MSGWSSVILSTSWALSSAFSRCSASWAMVCWSSFMNRFSVQATNRTEVPPSPPTVQYRLPPATTGTRGDCEPERMMSPAFRPMPSRPSVLASQATALTGEPCTEGPHEGLTISPFFSSTLPGRARAGWGVVNGGGEGGVEDLGFLFQRHAGRGEVDVARAGAQATEREHAAGGV